MVLHPECSCSSKTIPLLVDYFFFFLYWMWTGLLNVASAFGNLICPGIFIIENTYASWVFHMLLVFFASLAVPLLREIITSPLQFYRCITVSVSCFVALVCRHYSEQARDWSSWQGLPFHFPTGIWEWHSCREVHWIWRVWKEPLWY